MAEALLQTENVVGPQGIEKDPVAGAHDRLLPELVRQPDSRGEGVRVQIPQATGNAIHTGE